MPSSFVAYIDESGDEGFKFDRRSSEWFVLSAAIVRQENDLALVKLMKEVRVALGRDPLKPLHFRDLKHHHRVLYIGEIAKGPLKATSILFRKPALISTVLREPNCLYFYGVRFLFERISWLCRDTFQRSRHAGNGKAEIIFSNRSWMPYAELKSYMDKLRSGATMSDVRIAWDCLEPEIQTFSHGARAGLQVADAIAGSLYKAVEPVLGYTEDRYVKMLKPVIYERYGKYQSYGIKVWPKDAAMIESEERFRWLREDFAKK
jgi:hypothetical protein